MSMLAACFRSAEKEDTKPVESESESETNAEATSEDEATKQENKIESAKKAFEKELQNLDAVFKNNPDISPEIAVVAPEVHPPPCLIFLHVSFALHDGGIERGYLLLLLLLFFLLFLPAQRLPN
jgi:hypothetical protein